MYFKIIITIIILVILYIFLSNNHLLTYNENNHPNQIYIAKNNITKVSCSNEIRNRRSVDSRNVYKTVNNLNSIEDNILVKPNQIKPFTISGNIDLKHNIYVPPLNQYDVQSGLYDNNSLPKPQVFKPIGVEVKNRVNLDSNDSNKYIHEIYDEILKDRPITGKELDDNTYKIIPAYKGSSINIDNWNYYKNEDYSNGGAYNNLIGIENNKTATQRIIDEYNDFELKEWI